MKKISLLFLLACGLGSFSETRSMAGFDAIIEDEYVPPRTLTDELNDARNPQEFYKNFVHKAIKRNSFHDVQRALMMNGRYATYPSYLTSEELQDCRKVAENNNGACCLGCGFLTCVASTVVGIVTPTLTGGILGWIGGVAACGSGNDSRKKGRELVGKIDQLIARVPVAVIVVPPLPQQSMIISTGLNSERGPLGSECLNSYGALDN